MLTFFEDLFKATSRIFLFVLDPGTFFAFRFVSLSDEQLSKCTSLFLFINMKFIIAVLFKDGEEFQIFSVSESV